MALAVVLLAVCSAERPAQDLTGSRAQPAGQRVGGLVPGGRHGVGVGLGEDRAEHGGDHVGVAISRGDRVHGNVLARALERQGAAQASHALYRFDYSLSCAETGARARAASRT